jgi:hypothetical protein
MKANPAISILIQSTRLLLVLILLLWGMGAASVTAQSGTITWSKPINLSNSPEASGHPVILADNYGYVHVFWTEEVGGEPMESEDSLRNTGNTILYVRWDGVSWTPPLDILFVPSEALAEWPAVDIDPDKRLHLVWISSSRVYYSSAPSWEADSVRAWRKPLTLADGSAPMPWSVDVAADVTGALHVIYATGGGSAGVYYVRSSEGGDTWQPAIKLSDPFDRSESSFSMLKIIADDSGNLHATWQTNQAQGYGQAVYYARSTDGGDNWSAPVQLGYRDPEDFETSWPYLVALGPSELHLVYVDGEVVGSQGRFHRISKDGGETWSEPHHIITSMMGINGFTVPVVDGAGQMHLIINMRTRDIDPVTGGQVGGIFYARWLGNGWSPVVPVAVGAAIPTAHHTEAAVRLGNEIHIVSTQLHGGEIWYLRGTISSVSQRTVLDLPSPEIPTPSPAGSEVASRTPGPTSAPTTTQPAVQPVRYEAALMPTPSILENPLVLGAGLPFLLVTAVVAWARLRRN